MVKLQQCTKCLIKKQISDFAFRNKVKQIRHRMCRLCHTKYRRFHYLQNKEKYIQKAKRWNVHQREVLKEVIFRKLSQSACIDCGEKDIVVLDFDHIASKRFSIAVMFRHRHSVESIEDELQNCVVRCANCHRRRTAKQFNHWKSRLTNKIGP